MARVYQRCTRCVMDTTDPEIMFDDQGVCNHCRAYQVRASKELYSEQVCREKIERLVAEIKDAGQNSDYDCVIGVSGGVDSTMVAWKVKELGLRPLAVHVDNGWNSELAVYNIEYMLKKLNIDLYTIVLDWEEFRDLQLAFLYSSVPNLEIPTDHALPSLLFKTASDHGIKYIISGSNVVSEAIMPLSWIYDSRDAKLIKAIQSKFGTSKLKTYPLCTFSRYFYYTVVRGIKWVPILNYLKYNKKETKEFIQKELGWRDYGGKHFESIFTRFFQGYILPNKFNMDKRLPHLSSLICSGQMTKEEALVELQSPAYQEDQFREDYDLFLKKMRLSPEKFEEIMKMPVAQYSAFPSNAFFLKNMKWFIPLIKSIVKPKSLKNSN